MVFCAKRFDGLTTSELYEILRSRSEIFMLEQNIHCQDMDGVDYDSLHCFLEEDGRVVGYLRAYASKEHAGAVKIGRVLSLCHGVGIGTVLMEKSLIAIKEFFGCDRLYVNSQKHAVTFYERFGFCVISDEFLEEGVPHLKMTRQI